MTDKKPVPPSLAQFALEQLAGCVEQTATSRAEELIADLEAEIVKRDARIVELEASQTADMFLTLTGEISKLNAELAALKAQPSGVVPGWLITHGRDGSIVVQKPGRGGYVASMDTDNIASSILHALASDMLAESLNPCRAQAVPDGYVLVPVEPTPAMRAVIMSGISHDHVVRIYKDMLSAIEAGQGEAVAWSLPDMETSMVLHSAWLKLSGEGQPSIETLKSHYSAISAALADTVPPASAADVSVPKSRFNNYEITLMINDLDHAEYSDITAALREYAELRALLRQEVKL